MEGHLAVPGTGSGLWRLKLHLEGWNVNTTQRAISLLLGRTDSSLFLIQVLST